MRDIFGGNCAEKWHLGDQRPSLHRLPTARNYVGRYASVTDVFTCLLRRFPNLSIIWTENVGCDGDQDNFRSRPLPSVKSNESSVLSKTTEVIAGRALTELLIMAVYN